jgi:hypothetical protein
MRLRALLAVLVGLLLGPWAPATSASAATYTYDVPTVERVGVHTFGVAEANPPQLSAAWERSASPSVEARGASTTPVHSVVATEAASGASNAATAPALARQLAGEEASSIFTRSGGLQQSVIDASREIIPGTDLSNGQLIKTLTADGSSIADWGKFSTPTFNSPAGPFQVHFYMNPSTGIVHYLDDFKVVFNGPR